MNKKRQFLMRSALALFMTFFSLWSWGQTPQVLDYTMPNNAGISYLTSANGWSYVGIGSDYSSSGSNIKFDTGGDNATLRIASAPNTVKYNLKGNSLSGAYNFQLSESPDGTTFSTVQIITTGIATSNTVFTANLTSTTRYIRWTYVTKATGNIGFGGVNVTAATGHVITTSAATGILATAATLNGTINANGVSTDASFEWGLTTAYGNTQAATPATVTGTTATAISADLSGLSVNTQYHYRAVGTSGATPTNGANAAFWTLANVPSAVTVNNAQLTTLDVMLNATDGNPANTEYAINETSTGKYVQADGTLAAAPVWQTTATWGTKTVTGLTAATNYTFHTKARNGANVETAFGPTASGATTAPETVDYSVVQWPNQTQNIDEGNAFTVYIRAFEQGVTEGPEASARIKAWVGYSSMNDNPANAGWTWVPATFNVQVGNDDEYQANIPTDVPGTYYYAARFEMDNSGVYKYGGSGGNWNADNVQLNVLADVVDYANIQSPSTATIFAGNTVTVYAQAYEPGATDSAGQGAGITAEIGYSSTNAKPDATWTWIPATFNVDSGNNDEYKAELGSGLSAGTYYYASRFKKSTGSTYVYGGTAGIWNNDSGVLTVNTLEVPTATAATNVTTAGFTANWNAVNGAESYVLEVYEETGSPMTDLIISEYIEGSSNNKYIEIFNGTGADVNLSSYKINLYTNGSTSPSSQALTGILPSGETLVYRNSLATLNTTFQTSSITNFNGDDALALVKGSPEVFVDIFGVIGNDPGTNWTSNGFSTVDQTLRRKSSIKSGVTTNPGGTGASAFVTLGTEWDSYPSDTANGLGSHTANTVTQTLISSENVGNVLSMSVTGLNPASKYTYKVKAVNGAVTSAASNTVEVTTLAIPTWNGTAWSNTTGPDASMPAIIDGDYSGPSFESASLQVNAGKTLTVTNYVRSGNVTNNGTITVAHNANFVQTGSFTAGPDSSFKVRKDSKEVKRQAYINWSSPMSGSAQTLKAFSYGKLADGVTSQSATGTLDNRFYTYDNGVYVQVTNPSVATFSTPGAGYLIRTPNDFTTTAQIFHAQFEGKVPNSGTITYDHGNLIGGSYILLGNPYPGALSIEDFWAANPDTTGTVYIWDSGATMDINGNYAGNNYSTYSAAGANPTGSIDGYIPTGQGFFVERTYIDPFVFTDSMRRGDQTGIFNRPAVQDRFWLEMASPSGAKPQMLIGFNAAAGTGYDKGYDAKMFSNNADVLYSTVDGQPLIIDAHGLFDETDTFNLNANFGATGTYTLGLLQREGIFSTAQKIFLKDNATGILTDLTSGSYSFTAEAGLQENRFTIQFRTGVALGTETSLKESVAIFADGKEIHVKADANIAEVEVYEMSGKLIAAPHASKKNAVFTVQYRGPVTVKVRLQNGTLQTKKLMLN